MSANAEKDQDPPRRTSSYVAMGVLGVGLAGVLTMFFVAKPGGQTSSGGLPAMQAAVPQVGQPAPDFDLPRADGSGDVKLSALRGHEVLLVFYRTHT